MTEYEARCMREDEEDRLRAMRRVTYTIKDLIIAMLLGIVLGAFVVAASTADAADHDLTGRQQQCMSPCTVILPRGTLEDEFGIDYGWKNGRPRVDVYVTR